MAADAQAFTPHARRALVPAGQVAELKVRLASLEQSLRLGAMREFELLGEEQPSPPLLERLRACCLVVEALGYQARDELIDAVCRREMGVYTQVGCGRARAECDGVRRADAVATASPGAAALLSHAAACGASPRSSLVAPLPRALARRFLPPLARQPSWSAR